MEKKGIFSRGYVNKPVKNTGPKEVITLDAQQSNAAYSKGKDILVVAGAGSGKTRLLTERVKFLLESGTLPSNIVAITFTNMAADEMKERLSDVPGIGDAFVGTIHSFANRVMKLSGETYKIFDDSIDNEFHRELISKYCHFLKFERYIEYKDLRDLELVGKISESEVKSFFTPSERAELNIIERLPEEIEAEIKLIGSTQFPESVRTLCNERGVITFEELIEKAEVYFRSIDATIEHVLVDEFQDVGTLEFNFIDALGAENYFLVGDDWQSLYRFKGGNVGIFLRLIEEGSFEVHYLTNNYRNSRAVLEFADLVISQVTTKIPKTINQISAEEGEATIVSKNSIDTLLSKIERSGEFKEWFFLCRTNKEVFELVDHCVNYEIPCVTFKREGMSLADVRSRMESNKVKILTVHSAKGLEVDNVLLYGNFPMRCPSYRCNEDERKVMYVGITRAKKNVIVMN